MIEKWLLVLLIVGCTSLVFLICFPIDFFLYRRRKRLARERKNKLPIYQLRHNRRAEQNHAKITTHHMLDMDIEELRGSRSKLDSFRAQVGLTKFFSKLKKKHATEETSEQRKELTELKSDNSTEFQILSTSPDVMGSPKTVSKGSETGIPSDGSLKQENVQEMCENNKCENLKMDSGPSLCMKLPNLSSAWGENEELVDHENKHLNYGALEPFGNGLQSRQGSFPQEDSCFTIPMNKRYKILRTNHGESCTDFDVRSEENALDNYAAGDDRERLKPASPETEVHTGNSDQFIEYHDFSIGNSRERVRSCEGAMLDHFDLHGSKASTRFPKQKVLEHSYSDQFISYNSNAGTTRTNSRKAKKRNVVSPSPKPSECFSEQIVELENDNRITNKQRNEFLTSHESLVASNAFKKKKKTKMVRKKQSSESMPELSSNKEKF